jgi:hypothetical protein
METRKQQKENAQQQKETDEVRNCALNQGLYFIEYSGENFYITPPNGQPKEW